MEYPQTDLYEEEQSHSGEDKEPRKRTPGFADYEPERVAAWVTENYRYEKYSKVPKNEVFREYHQWGEGQGLHLMTPNIFGKFLFLQFPGMTSCRPGKIGHQVPHYMHLAKNDGGSAHISTPTPPTTRTAPPLQRFEPSPFSSFHISQATGGHQMSRHETTSSLHIRHQERSSVPPVSHQQQKGRSNAPSPPKRKRNPNTRQQEETPNYNNNKKRKMVAESMTTTSTTTTLRTVKMDPSEPSPGDSHMGQYFSQPYYYYPPVQSVGDPCDCGLANRRTQPTQRDYIQEEGALHYQLGVYKNELKSRWNASSDVTADPGSPKDRQSLADAISTYGRYLQLGTTGRAKGQFCECLTSLQKEQKKPVDWWRMVVDTHILASTAEFWFKEDVDARLLNIIRETYPLSREQETQVLRECVSWYANLCRG